MKSAENSDNEIEVAADETNDQLGRVRIRERHGVGEIEKCSIFLTPDQLEEHARDCLALAVRIRSRRSCEVERDALRAEIERMRPVYEMARMCPFTSGDGWLMCQLRKGHGGSCQMKDISVTKAKEASR